MASNIWVGMLGFLASLSPLMATEPDPLDFTAPPHRYHERILSWVPSSTSSTSLAIPRPFERSDPVAA